MIRTFILTGTFLLIFALGLAHINCSNNSAPSSPNAPTATFSPTSTVCMNASNTPCTSTFTFTPTQTATSTDTPTQTYTLTMTRTFTPSNTPSKTPTNTSTSTPCGYPGNTCTYTFTPTSTYTFTESPTPTQTPTETATFTPTQTYTPVACATNQFIGYVATPDDTGTDNSVVITELNLAQASDVTAMILGGNNSLPVTGFNAQPVIYSDNGSNYPKAILYASSTTVTGLAPVTFSINPVLSLPSGNYWFGYYGIGIGAAATDGVTATGSLYYATDSFNPHPISFFNPFPPFGSLESTSEGNQVGNLSIEIKTCHP